MPYSRLVAGTLLVFGLGVLPAFAQRDDAEWLARCQENRGRWDRNRAVHCEVKEARIALPSTAGTLTIDGRQNGGISVVAAQRGDVLIRSRIQTYGESQGDAATLAGRISIVTGGADVHAEGPETRDRQSWSVSFVVEVPAGTNLRLTTHNGPISIDGMRSTIEMRADNGPISVRRASGGDIRGRASNGPVSVDLDGSRWEGRGLDLETTNGPVALSIPENYSAALETGTVNGPMSVDFPMTVTIQGRVHRRINTTLGSGGAPVRVVTTNGPVSIRRR